MSCVQNERSARSRRGEGVRRVQILSAAVSVEGEIASGVFLVRKVDGEER